MPLLFGTLGQDSLAKGIYGTLCISREFGLFASGSERPLTAWLRALCQRAKGECARPGVGGVGMCITGKFAISLMVADIVLASVASQPALPLPVTAALGAQIDVTGAELAQAKARAASGAQLMALHFTGDRLCPKARIDTLKSQFGPALIDVAITSPDPATGIGRIVHAVLTLDFCDKAGHPTRIARYKVTDFLHAKL